MHVMHSTSWFEKDNKWSYGGEQCIEISFYIIGGKIEA